MSQKKELPKHFNWIPTEDDPPPPNTVVLGWSPKWVDEDFEPEGIRECFRDDTAPGQGTSWNSCKWDNDMDTWWNDCNTSPVFWMRRPEPPKFQL